MEKIEQFLRKYALFEYSSLELVRESSDNIVYSIGKTNKRILRMSKKTDLNDLMFEFEAIEFLSKKGVPVAKIIRTSNNQIYTNVKGKIAVLFEFIDGYHIEINKEKLPTITQAETAGRTLAIFSNTGRAFISKSRRSRDIFSEINRAIEFKDRFINEFNGGRDFIDEIDEIIKYVRIKTNSDNSLIHNDFRTGNIIFKDDSEISGIIDFDWCCIGPRIKDLAHSLLEWSFPDGRLDGPDWNIFDAFLNGYNSISDTKYSKDTNLYKWIMFSALSDTATYFCDRINSVTLKKDINYSYMYKKFKFFKKHSAMI